MEKQIAIIGAGIIGVTSACRILETIPNVKITIYAEKFSPNTTSDVSAGYWEPFCLGDGQSDLILKWGKETYDRMMKVAQSENANKCGVQAMTAYIIQDKNHAHVPYWTSAVSNFKTLSLDEINNIISNNHEKKYQNGFEFLTTTCVLNRYIPYLSNELKKNGVKFVHKKFTNLSQFIDKESDKYDYIINCTGMGAKEFVPDPNMFPTKGQVLRVKAPWLKSCIMFDSDEVIYTLPLSDLVVVGGTLEEHVYDSNTNECDAIMTRCAKYLPSIKDAQVVSKHAGQRPSRKGGIRLEIEIGPKAKVIHNYGHGGSGVTLSWGCASDVAELIRQDMRGNSISSRLKSKL